MSAVRTGYLEGRVAVVTGGCGGIGTAVCARFAAEGASVYATGLTAPAGDSLPGVTFHLHDVTREESAVALMSRVEREHGRLDVLVNAAGIEIEKTVEHTSLEEWNRIFAVNVTGTFLTSKHALALMRKAGGGSIINFGSYDGFIADPNLASLDGARFVGRMRELGRSDDAARIRFCRTASTASRCAMASDSFRRTPSAAEEGRADDVRRAGEPFPKPDWW